MMPSTYSFIIPAYNESERLSVSLPMILDYVRQQQLRGEIIVVNDGSTDDTAAVVRGFMTLHPDVRLVENPGNRGKGYSVRHGMLQAQSDVMLFTDADLSSPIYEASKLFDAIEGGADVAIGSRWLRAELQTERQPWHRQLYGRLFNLGLRIVLGLNYRDTQCGFKAFTRAAAQTVFQLQTIERWGFDPEILFIARKRGYRVDEVPVSWAHDERTRISYLRDGTRMLQDIAIVRWNALLGRYNKPVERIPRAGLVK